MNLRLISAMPESAAPSSMTVVPPSGTLCCEAENVKVWLAGTVDGSWKVTEKFHVVGSKLGALKMPVPEMATYGLPPRTPRTKELVNNSKLMAGVPKTFQNGVITLEEVKFNGAENTIWVLGAITPAMDPLSDWTTGLAVVEPDQETTVVADDVEPVFNAVLVFHDVVGIRLRQTVGRN